jgi:hypothetical protein
MVCQSMIFVASNPLAILGVAMAAAVAAKNKRRSKSAIVSLPVPRACARFSGRVRESIHGAIFGDHSDANTLAMTRRVSTSASALS